MSNNNSSGIHLGHDIEWSVDLNSEVLIQSFGSGLLHLISVDDVPFLSLGIVFFLDFDAFSFSIIVVSDSDSSSILDVFESLCS
jgi:hypothetical protein